MVLTERRRRGLAGILLVLVVASLALYTLTKLPDITTARLPGAAGGSDTYSVDAQFTDVLDLVPNSTVRLADVPVGRVTGIDVATGGPTGHYAVAHLQINDRYQLPATTTATIRSTSLLGEKYVALTAPAGQEGIGTLRSARTIPLARTTQDVEVEQLLASIGAVLNGGGLQQLSTITEQFAASLDGHEQDTRALLGNLDDIVGQLDEGKQALVDALDSANRLSGVLAAQNDVIGSAVDALDPATGVLARQQKNLTRALQSLQTLDSRATSIIRKSTSATVADLDSLVPVTHELGKVAKLIPENLTLLVTYPFADNSIPAFSGAYGALKGLVDVNLPQLLQSVVPTPQDADQATDQATDPATVPGHPDHPEGGRPGLLGLPGLPALPALPGGLGALGSLLAPLLGGP